MKMFLVFAFIAAELVIVLKAFSGYSRRQLNHLFDTSQGFLLPYAFTRRDIPALLFIRDHSVLPGHFGKATRESMVLCCGFHSVDDLLGDSPARYFTRLWLSSKRGDPLVLWMAGHASSVSIGVRDHFADGVACTVFWWRRQSPHSQESLCERHLRGKFRDIVYYRTWPHGIYPSGFWRYMTPFRGPQLCRRHPSHHRPGFSTMR
jgi:hypothetical protein